VLLRARWEVTQIDFSSAPVGRWAINHRDDAVATPADRHVKRSAELNGLGSELAPRHDA
jgi:hypothetical protein